MKMTGFSANDMSDVIQLETSQTQFFDRRVDVPGVTQKQVATFHRTQTPVDVPQVQYSYQWSQTEIDHVTHGTKGYRDEDKIDKLEIKAKNGLKNYCVTIHIHRRRAQVQV